MKCSQVPLHGGTGTIAKEALESFLEKGAHNPPYPPMSKDIAEVLMRCFRKVPEERWESLDEAADSLQAIYKKETGKKYHRKKPTAKESSEAPGVSHDRRIQSGMKWDDPMKWLEKALKAAGRDLSELERTAQKRKGSRKSRALIDLQVYERALEIYSDLERKGMKNVENDLSRLLVNKAIVHEYVDDFPGAIVMYDLSIAILKRLVKEGSREIADHLALAYINKANAFAALGDKRGALKLYDKAMPIVKRLDKKGPKDLTHNLSHIYNAKANAVTALGDKRGALKLYDRSIARQERRINKEDRKSLHDPFVQNLLDNLAVTYLNKAVLMNSLGKNPDTAKLFDKAIVIWERLVYSEGRVDLIDGLAMACLNKGIYFVLIGNNRGALKLFDKAIAIRERLFEEWRSKDVAEGLAMAYTNKSATLNILGENRNAIQQCDNAIAVREELIKMGHSELLGDLAKTKLLKILISPNEKKYTNETRLEARKAFSILQKEVQRTGRADLQSALNAAKNNLADLLK